MENIHIFLKNPFLDEIIITYAYILNLAEPNKVLVFTKKSVYLFLGDSDAETDFICIVIEVMWVGE